jgi:hypothetical protein
MSKVTNHLITDKYKCKFRLGNIVQIVPGSRYDLGTSSNPSKIDGVVDMVDEELDYVRVQWKTTGNTNVYSFKDLIKIKEK